MHACTFVRFVVVLVRLCLYTDMEFFSHSMPLMARPFYRMLFAYSFIVSVASQFDMVPPGLVSAVNENLQRFQQ